MNLAIIGAGLSGLIAATQFPGCPIYESRGEDSVSHRALLRFRSDALSRLTGIPFRKVKVRKSIWANGRHCQPSIYLANQYSKKTNGGYIDRSIWNLDTVERFIAPENLHAQLVDMAGGRVQWNTSVAPADSKSAYISTIPMPQLLRLLGWQAAAKFEYKSIQVDRFRIVGADVFQTIYYPDPDLSVYRASITGDLLIVERMEDPRLNGLSDDRGQSILHHVAHSFGINAEDIQLIPGGSHHQRFGKIAPYPFDAERRNIIYHATTDKRIYSLGRFATWRNILLDDVVEDVATIKRMINHGNYAATLKHTSQSRERKELP